MGEILYWNLIVLQFMSQSSRLDDGVFLHGFTC